MLAEGEELDFHTLRGAAQEEEGRTPYAPLVEALDPLAARRPELAGALADSAQVALSRLLPSVRAPARAADEPLDRRRVFWAVAQLLGRAAAERGVVLVIDDLNAADEATVALVHHLARSAAGVRLLVVAGMRDEPLPEAAAVVRSSLLARGVAVDLALGPLDRGALAAVAQRAAGRPLRPGALSAIERAAAGNPFFAEELAASVDASGEVTVSMRLREVVARRLERLDRLGERLLAALAVIDDGFTDAELAVLAGAERVDEALSEARTAGVLERVRGRYRFRHSLVREELAARLPEDALRRTHADAAVLLAADDAPPERVAHHLLRAGHCGMPSRCLLRLPGGPRAWAPTAMAPDGPSWRSSMRMMASVRRSLRCGRSYFTGPGRPRSRRLWRGDRGRARGAGTGAAVKQARAWLAAGDIAGAKAALERFEPERPEDLAESTLVRGMVAWHTGDWERARRVAIEAEGSVPIRATLPS